MTLEIPVQEHRVMSYREAKAHKAMSLSTAIDGARQALDQLKAVGAAKPMRKTMARAIACTASGVPEIERAETILQAREMGRRHPDETAYRSQFRNLDKYINLLEHKTRKHPVLRIQWPIPSPIEYANCPICGGTLDSMRDSDTCYFCGSGISWD